MARKYNLGVVRRTVNRLVARSVERGKGDARVHLLTTLGRRSGQERTTPVTIIDLDDNRWLVAPYGGVGWVHNIRAAGSAVLSRGETRQEIQVTEATPAEAAPVLAGYLKTVAIVRPYFDVSHTSPLSDIEAVAHKHPVFRIE